MSRKLYIAIVAILTITLFLSYFPVPTWCYSWLTSPVSLALGLLFALIFGQPYPKFNKKSSKHLLEYSVIGLGFGMNLYTSLESGSGGMIFTILSVVGTLALGWFLGTKVFRTDSQISYLLSVGTAICGGSAIAATSSVLKAKETDVSVALGTVFILNTVGFFIFPTIGHWLGLDQTAFGTWAAISLHDTSSVVGAGSAYGEEALYVATTIKLTRALWIIPVCLATVFLFNKKGEKIPTPWFILGFICAILLNTFLPAEWMSFGSVIYDVARKMLTLVMFFIGASLSIDVLKTVGVRVLLQGIALWLIISVLSLLVVI